MAFWVSRPKQVRDLTLSEDERRAFRRITRKTWRFFETFVGDEDHWLPPDNFQEIPDGRIAHRTSPTNQGLLLLSTLAAHDLGYLSLGRLAERLEKTFDALERMEKHWGHFYNWYETRTLRPLPPGLHLDGRQRQPPGLPAGAQAGLERKDPRAGAWPRGGRRPGRHLRLIDEPWRSGSRRLEQICSRTSPATCSPGTTGWSVWNARPASCSLGSASQPAATTRTSMNRNLGAALVAQIRERRDELAALAPWLPLLGEPRIRTIKRPRPRTPRDAGTPLAES